MSQNTTDLNSTNSIAIAGVVIRQDEHGRFCLNDLHKAAGGEKKHQPANWLRTQQVIDLVAFLESEERVNKPIEVLQGGLLQGTFAIKELVYAYATWISAKFFLTVIRAYDALVNNKPPYGLKDHPVNTPAYLTPNMVQHIKEEIAIKVNNQGVPYQTCYDWIHKKYKANSITTVKIVHYPSICNDLHVEPREEMPKYIMVDSQDLGALQQAQQELTQIKSDPTLSLPCGENELWTKCTNDDVIIPYQEFKAMADFIESHQKTKDSIADCVKQAFEQLDQDSENILVGRQRWNELNFIVKKVMSNPQALAIL